MWYSYLSIYSKLMTGQIYFAVKNGDDGKEANKNSVVLGKNLICKYFIKVLTKIWRDKEFILEYIVWENELSIVTKPPVGLSSLGIEVR